VGHSVFIRGEIEFYGDEDVPPRARDCPTECRLYVPGADIEFVPDRRTVPVACVTAELI